MNDIKFDKALSDFLDDDECETASEAVYQLIRAAFAAGWNAAMGSGLREAAGEGLAGSRAGKQPSAAPWPGAASWKDP